MTVPKVSSELSFRIQKIGTILAPPIAAGITLLARLDLFYVALFTMAVAFPASLFNRRLNVYSETAMAEGRQDLEVELLEGQSNTVIYKTRNGTQIIGFYKISQRPQRQFLHTLNSTVANSNLAMSLLDNVNGTFLVIRFPGKGYRNRRRLIYDAIEHLKTYTQTITQDMPGLKLEPASLDELRNLTGLLGLSLARIASYKANNEFDITNTDLDRGRREFQSTPAKNDDVPEMPTESYQAGKSTNAEMEPINEVSAIPSETSPQFNSSISKIDHETEIEGQSSVEPPIISVAKQKEDQFFTLEEILSTDSRIPPINNERTLLKTLHQKKSVSRSHNQPKREIKSKGLTLEQYIGESVRQNLNNAPETLTPNAKIIESKEKKDNDAQAHEHSILTAESVSLDQKHSFNPSLSDNNDSGLGALSKKKNKQMGEEDAQVLGNSEERKVAVVDGNNVAWSVQKKRKPKLENILHMRDALVEQGYEVITWVSAKLRHDIDRQAELEEMIRSNKILQAPAGTNDDKFILKTAERLGGFVVSNDQFRDFPKEAWLQDRRLNYSIVGEEVFIVDSSRPKKKKTEKKNRSKESSPQSASNLHHFAEDNALVVTKLSELHQRVTQTLEGLKGSGNDGGLTHTGMRVAGRLVVKDLIEFLETAETLKGSPNSVKNALKELRQYIVEQLGISTETDMNPEELWKRIPGGAEKSGILLEILNESLADYREDHRQESKTLQLA
ncbi:MAG: hypothetical protein ACE5OZ_00310 [Candidatus Heimdallarchaeota archaeon]